MTPRLRWRRKGAYWVVLVSFEGMQPATKVQIGNWIQAQVLLRMLAEPGPQPSVPHEHSKGERREASSSPS
jgi:hypothetical protein